MRDNRGLYTVTFVFDDVARLDGGGANESTA